MTNKRIVYIINNADGFVSHRLPLAIAARKAGWSVHLLTGQPGSQLLDPAALAELQHRDIPYTRLAFTTAGINPLREGWGLLQLIWHVARLKPAVIHTASPKGGLYGGIAARLLRVPGLVVAISGMGFLFTGQVSGIKAHLKRLYSTLIAWVYRHPNLTVIVQNHDDRQSLLQSNLVGANNITLIPGSGVDLAKYSIARSSTPQQLVVLPARILRDKGVEEFVAAARILKEQGCDWRFALVGTADHVNPSSISTSQIQQWQDADIVEWWGHREDMEVVYTQADIVCLPSYREGMPKSLLEAAAAGCAVVTTDVTGCREAVIEGKTGDLVPVKDANALAAALGKLIADPERRLQYGQAGRELAAGRFGIDAVVDATMGIYQGYWHK